MSGKAGRRPSACDGVWSRLLEGADLAEIRESEAAHLEKCAPCRAALGRVESRVALLAEEIEAIEPRLSADEAVALATGARRGRSRDRDAGGGDTSGGRRLAGVSAASWRRRLAWAAGPAVALAAAILGVVWAGPWRPGPGLMPPPAALVAGARPAAEPGGLAVEAPETGGVAVFATRDPDIHVVWFYDRRPTEGDRQGERR